MSPIPKEYIALSVHQNQTAVLASSQIGVVIPSYREADNIARLVSEILKVLPQTKVVVVDDSPDLLTVQALEKGGFTQQQTEQIKMIHRTTKGGRGSAVLEGIRDLLAQGCNRIAEMDSDFSHPPAQLPELLSFSIQENVDLLIASRYIAQSRIENWPLSRRIFSKCSNLIARFLLNVPVHDYTNGYRVYSASAASVIVENCGHLGKGFICLSEILVNTYYRGLKVREVPTVFVNRLRGESSLNWSEIKNALIGLAKIYVLKSKLKEKLKEKIHVRLEN